MSRPAFRVWYLFSGLLIAAILTTDPFFIGVIFGFFLGAEAFGLAMPDRLDTFTEFSFWKITDRIPRILLALAICAMAWWKIPDPWTPWVAGPLTVWLPLHFAIKNMERRLIRWIKARL